MTSNSEALDFTIIIVIVFVMSKVDVSDYTASNEWEILSHPARKNVKYYSCCAEPYPDLTFTISLRRVAAFYNYVLVLPCVLLSFLTLVIFWLPPESPAKMMLGIYCLILFPADPQS